MENKTVELLAPAKDLASGADALNSGADAVYACGPEFGAPRGAAMSLADFEKLCSLARRRKARVYAAVNTILTGEEISRAAALLRRLWEAGAAAAIIQDFGLLETALPPIPLIAGMQTYIATPAKAAFLAKAGFSRLALPRELSTAGIKAIAAAVPGTELECFAYGKPCASYSGRCALSLALRGRSGNRGECARPCRSLYTLGGPGVKPGPARRWLSARGLNLSRRLGGLLDAGVNSFRVEGRVAFFRRELDKLMAARGLERAAAPRVRLKVPHAPAGHPYVFKEVNFSENVLNPAAEAFYRRHGVKKIELAAEAGLQLAGRKVMTIRRCLRKTLGACEKGKAAPLFLTGEDGRRLRLEFDCAGCRMFVFLER